MAANCNFTLGNPQCGGSFARFNNGWELEIKCSCHTGSENCEGTVRLTEIAAQQSFSVNFSNPLDSSGSISTILMIPRRVKEANSSKIRSVIRIIQANDGTTKPLSEIFSEIFPSQSVS